METYHLTTQNTKGVVHNNGKYIIIALRDPWGFNAHVVLNTDQVKEVKALLEEFLESKEK